MFLNAVESESSHVVKFGFLKGLMIYPVYGTSSAKKVSYCGKNMVGPDQTPRIMFGV